MGRSAGSRDLTTAIVRHLLGRILANKPLRCYRLSDKLPLKLIERTTCEGDSSWMISLPPRNPDEIDLVVCVEIAEGQVEFEPIHW